MDPRIRQQIDDVRAGRSTSIILGRGATEVPSELRELRNLRSLDLRGSGISSLPAWVEDVPDLEEINIYGLENVSILSWPRIRWKLDARTAIRAELDPGKISGIDINSQTPARVLQEVFDLGRSGVLNLEELSISCGVTLQPGNQSKQLKLDWPDFSLLDSQIEEFLGSQRELVELELLGCPFGRIPEPIRDMTRLAEIMLCGVFPENVPDWLFRLPALSSLDLEINDLAYLPDSLREARELKVLLLGWNRFNGIPSGVWELASLEHLGLEGCRLTEIPSDILRLKRLKTLELDSDPGFPQEIVSPPPEIVSGGPDAIRRYWLQERDVGVDYLAEAKLLIVGESGAGKTSLAKKILDPGYALDSDEDSTEGISVSPWRFPASVRVRDQDGEHLLERDFRVNIWDFGGQEIYHSTHQFFLTKRSVYALVTDERREDADFEYWLEVVNLLGGGSPLVIVQNRKHGRQQGIDLGAIRQRYPNMCGALVVDLADNAGLDAAIAKIRRELEQLPHIGTSLPKTWRDVRVALEGDPRNYIAAAEFFGICHENGFTDRGDMRQLGGYLHDLGICLFFQDDDELSDTVILKPEWGTRAVYRILDDPQVAAALGVFRRDDLRRIWSDASYEAMHGKLLRLMIKFGLCFPVPGADTFIAPQLLTPSQPPYHWDETGNLVLRYAYEVMPKGIVRRLIVALHDLIVPGGYLWRSGAVFEYDLSRAEVIEQYRRRVLTVRLQGGDPRVLLGIIDHELGLIHRSYPGIKFEKLMPCTCPVCAAASEPATYAVSELEDFARSGDQIQCRVSRRLLDPAVLLRTLWRDPAVLDPERLHAAAREAPPPQPEVFISYKWGGASEALADQVQTAMTERGVTVTRDKSKIAYRDSIEQFMRRLGAGKCVIVILDDAYLRSKNCMFELTEIASRPEFRSRVFPVVMADAAIFDPVGRLGYVKYWEDKRAELDQAMKGVGQENLQGIREELDLYETIRNTIAGLMDVLADMNTLTPEIHGGSDFGQLYASLASVLP